MHHLTGLTLFSLRTRIVFLQTHLLYPFCPKQRQIVFSETCTILFSISFRETSDKTNFRSPRTCCLRFLALLTSMYCLRPLRWRFSMSSCVLNFFQTQKTVDLGIFNRFSTDLQNLQISVYI